MAVLDAEALFDYLGHDDDEITLVKNDKVSVLEIYNDGWWLVQNGLDIGLAPSNYLQPIQLDVYEAHCKSVSDGHGSRSSSNSSMPMDHTLNTLKSLKDQTDAKINALRIAVSQGEANSEGLKKRNSKLRMEDYDNPSPPSFIQSSRNSIEHDHLTSPPQDFMTSQSTGQGPKPQPERKKSGKKQNKAMQKVVLDPNSLQAISKLIGDKISKEFEERDSKIYENVKEMIEKSPLSKHELSPTAVSHPHEFEETTSVKRTDFLSHNTLLISHTDDPEEHDTKIPKFRLPKLDPEHKLTEHKPKSSRVHSSNHPPSKLPQLKGLRRKEIQKLHDIAAPSSSSSVISSTEGIHYPQCRSMVYGPSQPQHCPTSHSATLALRHVYGYSGDPTSRGNALRGKNICWVNNNKIVFPAAAVVIVMDLTLQQKQEDAANQLKPAGDRCCCQSFFTGHTDDVMCLAVHPGGDYVASGQMGRDSHILIWSTRELHSGVNTKATAVELKLPSGVRGVSGVDFSGDGRYLLAVGVDESHCLIVYDWCERLQVAQARVGLVELSQALFNPFLYSPFEMSRNDPKKSKSGCYTLVALGGKQLKFWTLKMAIVESESLDQISSFKGRKLNPRKKDKSSSVSYSLEGNLGNFPGKSQIPELNCCITVDDRETGSNDMKSRVFVGTGAGSVYIWQQIEDARSSADHRLSWQAKGSLMSMITDLHDSPIVDMDYIRLGGVDDSVGEEFLYERVSSSGSDGMVNVWLLQREEGCLPLNHIGSLELGSANARCISWDKSGESAVLGSVDNSISLMQYEEEEEEEDDKAEGGSGIKPIIEMRTLLQSNYGNVKRLAVNPLLPFLVASLSGSEKTVRIWHTSWKRLLSSVLVAGGGSCLAFGTDGKTLTVGSESGELLVFENESFSNLVDHLLLASQSTHRYRAAALKALIEDVHFSSWTVVFQKNITSKGGNETSPSKKNPKRKQKRFEITEMKYSPDGEILALGGKDHLIHLLSVSHNFKRLAVCRGHNACVRSIDFSSDGQLLQSADAGRELMHWDRTGLRVSNPTQYRDVTWGTWSSLFGWSVQGVFNGVEGTVVSQEGDIHCVVRSNDRQWLVAGTSHTVRNALKLFRYPCVAGAVPAVEGGHSSPVLDVVFCADSVRPDAGSLAVLSAGGNDSCIFQWELLTNSASSDK